MNGVDSPLPDGQEKALHKTLSGFDHEKQAKDKAHKCHICGRGFTLQAFLKTHLLRHAPTVPYDCSVCGRVFGRKCDFRNHMKSHQNEIMFNDLHSDNLGFVQKRKSEDISSDDEKFSLESESDKTGSPGCNISFHFSGDSHYSPRTEKPYGSSDLFVCTVCKDVFSSEDLFRKHRDSLTHQCETCEKYYSSCHSLKLHEKSHVTKIICKICNKIFASKQSLRMHAYCHAGEEKCWICEKRCKNKRILRLHMTKTHKKSSLVKCKECGQKFKRSELIQHKFVHRGQETYTCKECGSNFNALYKLENHIRFHKHTKKKWKCDICGKELATKYALETHTSTHTGEQECSFCGLKLLNEGCLKRHIASTHEGKVADRKSEKKVQCDMCGNMYGKSYIETHLKIHAGQKDFHCYKCGKKFVSRTNLREHQRSHNVEKSYCCTMCDKKFVTKKSLTIHTRKHTGETPYECSICSKTFVTSWTLKNHLRLHDLVEAFSCKLCGKKFSQKKSLLAHYAGDSHSKEDLQQLDSETLNSITKKYVCSVCGRNCFEKTRLTFHMRVHTGEKPYKCSDCGQMFRVESALKIHSKLHGGKMLFECRVCKKPFPRQSQALKHEHLHNGQKPHLCTICGKTFTTKNSLKLHVERHATESVYACSTCDQEFPTKRKYKAHQKSCSNGIGAQPQVIESSSLDCSDITYYGTMENVDIKEDVQRQDLKELKSVLEEGMQSIECSEYYSLCEDIDCIKKDLVVLEIDPIDFEDKDVY
ncbi:zinc finger protein 260-like [Macrobrachium nipponense]|uniref:zinc finger protein 260-like n=1 Tax=Macrobrachium nipponense TaxID=159736 RepID=UPI0030C7F138